MKAYIGWRRPTARLLIPGSVVTLVALGGSVGSIVLNQSMLALAILIALFAAWVGLLLPRLAWALYIGATALTGVAVHVGAATVRVDIISFPLLLGAALTSWTASKRNRTRLNVILLSCAGAWILLSFTSSALIAPEPSRSLWVWAQQLLGFAAFVLLATSRNDKRELYRIASGAIAVTVGAFIVAYLIFPVQSHGDPSVNVRLIGLSIESNILAAQCIAWLAVSYYWRHDRPAWTWFSDAIVFAGVVLSGTRSAWIAAFAFAVFAAVRWLRHRALRPRAIVLLLAGGAVYVASIAYIAIPLLNPRADFVYRILNLLDIGSGTGAYRVEIYRVAIGDLLEPWRIFLGTGVNSFSQFHPLDPTRVGESYLSTIWLAMPYDAGLLGAIAFFAALILIWRRSNRRLDALPLFVIVLICASATNSFWFAFVWVFFGLVSDRAQGSAATNSGLVDSVT